MPARGRQLKPDSKGRFRPYLGFRVDADSSRKEHRFIVTCSTFLGHSL
ncbi:hypothetical protein [Thalassoglobus polymorphus]|nr:hypothetical protein [Thalassoglobus polymorphus]